MMKFIHAIVLNYDEYDDYVELGFSFDFDDLASGDYIVHALYSVDRDEVILLDDNTHQPIEAFIDSFLDGIKYMGEEIEVTRCYTVVGAPYDRGEVCAALSDGDYTEVE